jgi:hypothetical protein
MSVQYYRLCPLGHKVICPSGLVRPRCGICGQQPESQSPLRRLDEELEETAAPRQERTPEPERNTPDPVGSQSPEQPEVGTTRQRRTAEQPAQPESPVPTRGRRPRNAVDEDAKPAQEPDTPADTGSGDLRLELFGMPIEIPAEGGFLGREALGARELEGFLLVSRRHVFVRPDRGGRLMVEDRGSTNGTWYTHADRRQRLDLGRTEILEPGDILWLYNIPLKVVT